MPDRDSRITISGATITDPVAGRFGYGVAPPDGGGSEGGSGRLTVTSGAQYKLTSAASAGVLVEIGAGAGWAGEVVVADPGSRLDILAGSTTSPGPRLRVGDAGGDGALLVLSGGAVAVSGATPAAVVGSGAGGEGLIDLIGGRLDLAGDAVSLVLGEAGGSGRMRLLSDGRLSLAASAGSATVEVGTNGGKGDLVIGSGRAVIAAGPDGTARLTLGSGDGDGRLDIAGQPPLSAADGATGVILLGGSGGSALEIGVGGSGAVALDGGALGLFDPGADPVIVAALMGAAPAPSGTAAGPVTLAIGTEGGGGTLTATGGAAVIGQGSGPVQLAVGQGGAGRLTLSDASLQLESLGVGLSLQLGTAGGAGLLHLGPGAEALLRAAGGLDAALGTGGSAGLEIAGGSLALEAGGALHLDLGADARMQLSDGGTAAIRAAETVLSLGGEVKIDAGTLGIDATGVARLDVLDGGSLNLGSGAVLRMTGGAGSTATGEAPVGDGQIALAADAELALAGAARLAAGGGLIAEGGLLRIDGEAWLDLGDEIALGNGARLVMDGGSLAAPFLGVEGGALLAGTGRLATDVALIGAELRIGDRLDDGAVLMPGLGRLEVQGSLAKAGGSAIFGFDAGGSDLLDVTGSLTLIGTALMLEPPAPGAPLPGGALLLARAAGGVTLQSMTTPKGLALELREDGTELWLAETAPPLTVTGTLRTPHGGALDGVVVSFLPEDAPAAAARSGFGATSGADAGAVRSVTADGAFALTLPAGSAGWIGAQPAPAGARPDTGAALEALRLSVGLRPSWGEARPEDFIAADITGDGQVTAHDALTILRSAVGLETAHVPRWVFLDAGQEIGPQSRDAVAYEPGLWIAPETDAHVDLTAILVGLPGAFG